MWDKKGITFPCAGVSSNIQPHVQIVEARPATWKSDENQDIHS